MGIVDSGGTSGGDLGDVADVGDMDDDPRRRANERLEGELSVLLRRARSMSMSFAREVHEGLDASEYPLLRAMIDTGELRAAELADRFSLDKSTVSRLVSHLEVMGLIERVADPADGRARLIRVTDEGRTRVAAVARRRRLRLRAALGEWPVADVDLLSELLGRFNSAMGTRADVRAFEGDTDA